MSASATQSPPPQLDDRVDGEHSLPIEVVYRKPPVWKRCIDILGSLALIVLLSPAFLVLGLYVWLVSPGPIIFRQRRIGAGTHDFVILKFRTMHVDRDAPCHRSYVAGLVNSDQPASKPNYASRLIRGGHVIRRLSLDELPQLFNVLMGDMSLVGPRPDVLNLEDYEDWQLRRFEVLPGISGLWQVSGKNRLSFNQMVRLDIQYIDHLGFWSDMSIMLKTIKLIVLRTNE